LTLRTIDGSVIGSPVGSLTEWASWCSIASVRISSSSSIKDWPSLFPIRLRFQPIKENGEYTVEVRLMSAKEQGKGRFMRNKRRANRPECWNTMEITLTERHDKKIPDYFNSLIDDDASATIHDRVAHRMARYLLSCYSAVWSTDPGKSQSLQCKYRQPYRVQTASHRREDKTMEFHQTPSFKLKLLFARAPHWQGTRFYLLWLMIRTEWELGQVYNQFWSHRETRGKMDYQTLLAHYQIAPVAWRSPRRFKALTCLKGQIYRLLLKAGRPMPPRPTLAASKIFISSHASVNDWTRNRRDWSSAVTNDTSSIIRFDP